MLAHQVAGHGHGLDFLTVTTTPGQKTLSAPKPAEGKYLVAIQPTFPLPAWPVLTANTLHGPGLVYMRISEVLAGSPATYDYCRVLWAGHLRPGATLASVPNARMSGRSVLLAEAWQSNGTGGGAAAGNIPLTVNLCYDNVPSGGTYIHNESPGSGRGYVYNNSLGNPAAGAEYANVTVPDMTLWRMRSVHAPIVTSANVANRRLQIIHDDGSAKEIYTGAGASLTASTNGRFTAFRGAALTSNNSVTPTMFPLPEVDLLPTYRMRFSTVNLDPLDDYAEGYYYPEEWAWPTS